MNAGAKTTPTPSADEGFSLGELLVVLWGGRWTILACALPALLLAGFLAWRATPIYQIDAMLQVESRQGGKGGVALEAKIEGLSEDSSQVQGEVLILQSNQVLGRAVKAAGLDLVTTPETGFLLGSALHRGKPNAPRLDVEAFEVPETALGVVFKLEAKGNGAFAWEDPGGTVLAQGRVGEEVYASWQGQPAKLKVRQLVGRPGQRFMLERLPILQAIQTLRQDFVAAEKGKETNILGLTLMCPQPQRGVRILNTILEEYTRENIERKTREASKTLALLREEMAQLREKQMKAEQVLNQSRAGARSADLAEEGRLVLQRSVETEKEAFALRQKRAELLRTYQERSDVVSTLDQQIARLEEEGRRLDAQARSLPRTQQEVVRLMKDVQVNQDHYSALMNLETMNIQQLQMARAGEMGHVRIVDQAMASLRPAKPQKPLVVGIGLMLGLMAGVSIVLVRHTVSRGGVEDPQVLEACFGLPVLATIPHSANQPELTRQSRKVGEEVALLSNAFPVDLAVESLRSLRTSLHFTLVDAPNRAIMIAGSSPDIGKSFVSANFAVILAQYGHRVLLVDADMRKGKLHRHFGAATRKDGLSEVLVGSRSWREVLHHAHGLDMISTGTLPPNPSKLLLGERFGAFMTEVCAAYDYVIIDAPPILAVTDAAIVGAHVGAVLLLVKDGQHSLGEIRTALQSLEIAGIKAKGFVFNDVNPEAQLGFYRRAYYYGYQS